jgi:toxin ParE1/3/4
MEARRTLESAPRWPRFASDVSWREHAEALDEYRAAANWYEANRPGWGDVFMDAVDAAITSILDSSFGWGFYRERHHEPPLYSRSVAGFPFDIIYLRIENEVYIVAYAHERRRPGYWERRVED